jgi:hypothetical protein
MQCTCQLPAAESTHKTHKTALKLTTRQDRPSGPFLQIRFLPIIRELVTDQIKTLHQDLDHWT